MYSAKDIVRCVPVAYDRAAAEEALAAAERETDRVDAGEAERRRRDQAAAWLADVEARCAAGGDAVPVYHVRVPTLRDRAVWRRAVAEAGARLPSQAELLDALRAALREVAPENLEALLEKVDLFAAMEAGKVPPDAELARDMAALETQLLAVPRYAVLVGARTFWFEIAPLVAAAHFLAGWENAGVDYAAERGRVSDELLGALPQGHAAEMGLRAIGLMSLTPAEAKNSASRSRSPAARPRMPAEIAPPTAGGDGSSTASSSPETPPSASTKAGST
jgi:hypothetical protein